MTSPPNNNDAHDCAERIRERLPRAFVKIREAAGLTPYAWKKSGVSWEMISHIEAGESIPTFHLGAKLAHGAG